MNHLNPDQFQVLSWNLQKRHCDLLHEELELLHHTADLSALQEAVLEPSFLSIIGMDKAFSFTPGYCTPRNQTGVLTTSRMPALFAAHHQHLEPWLRSPKAMHLTHHHLDGHKQQLLMINLHAVNFTVTDMAYRRQLFSLLPAIINHDGPVILTGDFNTWNATRRRCLKELITLCDLTEVPFQADFRKKVLRHPLDHMFTRGLTVLEANTHKTRISDHNPLVATLKLH